jgi:hypothetical protein
MEARTIGQAYQSPVSARPGSTASPIGTGLSQSAILVVIYCLLSNLGLIVNCLLRSLGLIVYCDPPSVELIVYCLLLKPRVRINCLFSKLGLIVYCYQQQAAINCLLLSYQNRIIFN